MKSATKLKLVAIWEFALAAGILAFWTLFFSADIVSIEDKKLKEIYLAFESAFPLADMYLFFILVIGATGLLKNKFYGYLCSLLAGAGLIFLGLLDIFFNAQQGIYRLGGKEAAFNVFINLLCLGSGLLLVAAFWKEMSQKAK